MRPLTLKQANAFIDEFHRHHKPAHAHRFSLAAFDGDRICGVCMVARPAARMIDQYRVAEVNRLATDGTKNACSLLYAAAARACDAMGFDRIQTYTLPSEGGVSLRAAGWTCEGEAGGGDWNRDANPAHEGRKRAGGRRTDQPMEVKWRWAKTLTNGKSTAAHEGQMK